MLLYMASRAELVVSRIRPALEPGACVVADRFASSTLAHQGAAGGLTKWRSVMLPGLRVVVTPDLVATRCG